MSSSGGVAMRGVIIAIGVLIILSTFFGWYNVRVSIDGGIIDTITYSISRHLLGSSGIATTYGLVMFGMALMMIISAACGSRYITAVAAVGCAVVGVMSVLCPPEVSVLLHSGSAEGGNLMDNFTGVLSGFLEGPQIASLRLLWEVAQDYARVELSHGVIVALMLSLAAVAISLLDIVRGWRK
jgi:hypothetical protein